MSARYYLNGGWRFSPEFTDSCKDLSFDDSSFEEVRIPHTVKETPFNYFDEHEYQMLSAYRKQIFVPEEWKGSSIRLTFEGAAHRAVVYVNGIKAGEHHCGYTAFTLELKDLVEYGKENLIALSLDSRENINQPPFGYVIDYMTYGGIYRDVYLDVSEESYIADVFVKSTVEKTVTLSPDISLSGNPEGLKMEVFMDGNRIAEDRKLNKDIHFEIPLEDIKLWDVDSPSLYSLIFRLSDIKTGKILDEKTVRHGFRKSEFREDGYYLNGKKLKIRGLNRHQSYPYVGYAMPDSMQTMDADILKYELGLNAVRTSHYPQAQSFYDRCDEIGLLVFTEIPGWQHIGDEDWKNEAVKNTEDMILQYRNHSSIILWGVRINESRDDDEFYKRTNEAAHRLDPTRPTGGVRAGKKMSFLEDVYTYNDFLHDGSNRGCDPKKKVTPDMSKPYLISEYNGHMYSTKAFDWEEHRREHAIRHANVLDAVAGEDDIAGSFGWCMFDYNTHKDFGSGDRICYHGVLDMFRNPKMAADIYAAEGVKKPVLNISSTMDIGEHPGCNRGATWIFSNADSIKMYKNGRFIKEYRPEDSVYKNLKHGPIQIDDFIGNAIEEGENFKKGQAKAVKEALNLTALNSLSHIPKKALLDFLKCILFYHMNFGQAVVLYNKYIGDWGGTSTVYRFEAIKDGRVVKTITKTPSEKLHLEAVTDHMDLTERKTYDVAAVRISAVDDNGNKVSFFNEPVFFETEGPIEVIGEPVIGLKGGMAGCYVRTLGQSGTAALTIRNSQCNPVRIDFSVNLETLPTV